MARLTEAQMSVLRALIQTRAANDTEGEDGTGWVPAFNMFKRPTVRALQKLGMLEPMHKGYVGPTNGQYHRITPAGRKALEAPNG